MNAKRSTRRAATQRTAEHSARTRHMHDTQSVHAHVPRTSVVHSRAVSFSSSARPVLGPPVVSFRCVVPQSQRILLVLAPLGPSRGSTWLRCALPALDVDVRFSTDLVSRPKDGDSAVDDVQEYFDGDAGSDFSLFLELTDPYLVSLTCHVGRKSPR